MLTIERLREVLNYDPITGIFTWKKSVSNRIKVGEVAGHPKCGGGRYHGIRIDSRLYLAHRLAWFYVHGKWPSDLVDHKDRNGLNNAIDNLREASQSHNLANSVRIKSRSMTGIRNVYRRGSKFFVSLSFAGKAHYGGSFKTLEAAALAASDLASKIHGEYVPLSDGLTADDFE